MTTTIIRTSVSLSHIYLYSISIYSNASLNYMLTQATKRCQGYLSHLPRSDITRPHATNVLPITKSYAT